MPDQRVVNLARILVQYSTRVQPKDRVAIIGTTVAQPLVIELTREVLRAGGYPTHLPDPEETAYVFFKEANDDQLQYISRFQEVVYGELEVLIGIFSSPNTRALTSIDPSRQKLRAKATAPLMQTFLTRAAAGELKWVATLFPTQAYAQDAEMSLQEFEDFVYTATYSDVANPVEQWMAIRAEQQRLVDWLAGKKQVSIRGPHVDLKLAIDGRPFINSDGTDNMPSGEIFTSPVEDSATGWIRFSYPAVEYGREVEGIELRFEQGRVVQASAKKNEEFLLEMLEVDEGARYLGEFAIGTNKRITRFVKNLLFDEKIGGTIHLAIGSGFPESKSQNKSGVHWDMICDMREGGQILVDGELFYESGEFKV